MIYILTNNDFPKNNIKEILKKEFNITSFCTGISESKAVILFINGGKNFKCRVGSGFDDLDVLVIEHFLLKSKPIYLLYYSNAGYKLYQTFYEAHIISGIASTSGIAYDELTRIKKTDINSHLMAGPEDFSYVSKEDNRILLTLLK